MEYVFVLEDEEIHQRAISKALKAINPLLKTKFFNDIEDFYKWLKAVMSTTGRVLDSEAEDPTPEKIRMMIAKAELIAPANLGILEKTRELLTHRGLCTVEEPLGFLLTAFDDPEFKFEQYKNPLLLNLIFKPFDEIILTQHLSSALGGFKKPEESTLVSQKTSAVAEMLKAIEVISVSDVGFTSKSNKNYPEGTLSKYYSGIFSVPGKRSVHARLARAIENSPSSFELEYRFYGAENAQVANLRKLVRSKEKAKPMERGPEGGTPLAAPVFAIIEHRESEFNILAGTIKRRFSGASLFRYNSRADFDQELNFANRSSKALSGDAASVEMTKEYVLEKAVPSDITVFGMPMIGFDLTKVLDKAGQNKLGIWRMGAAKEFLTVIKKEGTFAVIKFIKNGNVLSIVNPSTQEKVDYLKSIRELPVEVHFLLVSSDVDATSMGGWDETRKLLTSELKTSPLCYLLSGKSFSDADLQKLEPYFEDIFYGPLDRAYFLLKMIYGKYSMKILEDKLLISEKPVMEKVYASASVQVEEISEAGIGFKYHGQITKGSFREFVLDRPSEPSVPVLTGICYASEVIDEKEGISSVYFVFFGVRDHELKFIRLWIRDNYVHTKEKGN